MRNNEQDYLIHTTTAQSSSKSQDSRRADSFGTPAPRLIHLSDCRTGGMQHSDRNAYRTRHLYRSHRGLYTGIVRLGIRRQYHCFSQRRRGRTHIARFRFKTPPASQQTHIMQEIQIDSAISWIPQNEPIGTLNYEQIRGNISYRWIYALPWLPSDRCPRH